ncbi:MAG: GspE/PulE family protein, partial [Janthinobacterium lividum]
MTTDGLDMPVAPARLLPYGFAKENGVLVDRRRPASCSYRSIASAEALFEAQRHSGTGLTFNLVDDRSFEAELLSVYKDASSEATYAAGSDPSLLDLTYGAVANGDLLDTHDSSPVVRLINAVLVDAIQKRASDIHFETQETRYLVRHRIDGILRDMIEPARALAPLLTSRLKIMAQLDIAQKRLPQDGRVTLQVAGNAVDVRVSTIPTQHGERVVLRLLDRTAAPLELAQLGMSTDDIVIL